MNSSKAKETLKQLPESELSSVSEAPWHTFPKELVRDELVRRLKLRKDLSPEIRTIKYREIIDYYRRFMDKDAFDEWSLVISEIEELNFKPFEHSEKVKTQIKEMEEHHRQKRELNLLSPEVFEGKTKPGDWRPNKTEVCPVCQGLGIGIDSRMCSKCSGRGFISGSRVHRHTPKF